MVSRIKYTCLLWALIAAPSAIAHPPCDAPPPEEPQPTTGAVRHVAAAFTGTRTGEVGTATNPYATIKAACAAAKPGDTVLLGAGTYTENAIQFGSSGTASAPITVAAAPGAWVGLTTGSQAKWLFDFTSHYNDKMKGFGYFTFRGFKATNSRHIWRFDFPGKTDAERPHHILIEDVEADRCGSVIACRGAGVAHLTVRRCDFSKSWGTEGNIDIGVNSDFMDSPKSGSHDILLEDCKFHDSNSNQQTNGVVFQGDTHNVTIRRCKAWNNGKYGFACKGQGGFTVDRCAAWGNGSSQFYLRGSGKDDPGGRTVNTLNDLLLTNCIAIGASDSGGSPVVWRENADVRLYHCTLIAYAPSATGFVSSDDQNPPPLAMKADVRNCIISTLSGTAVRFAQGNGKPFLQRRAYSADGNLFQAGGQTKMKYQGQNWSKLSQWQTYWSRGEPGGDDGLNGPKATGADALSILGDPEFKKAPATIADVPAKWKWPADFRAVVDPSVKTASPTVGLCDISTFSVPALLNDYDGKPRPTSGRWTAGAKAD